MASYQALHTDINEGILFIQFTAAEAMEAGDIVALGATAGQIVKCGTSGEPFGFVSETVTAAGVADYEPGGLVSQTAKVGDVVGVYVAGGVYKHHQAGLTHGTVVYAVDGKATVSASTNGTKVGLVLTDSDAAGNALIKSYL